MMEKPLFWHQGLFLQPQHFQLLDRYVQSLSTAAVPYIQPHFWGIGKMSVQDAALGNHSFEIAAGAFVFPDGAVVTFPGNGLLDARSFSEGSFEGGKPLGVYIGIRKYNVAGENVTVLPGLDSVSEVTTRFVTSTESEEVVDLYQGGPEAQVRSMRYVLKLFWEHEVEQLGDYELIPIAVLTRSGEEIIRSSRYFPPCLNISAIPPFRRLITELRDQLASRAHQLEAYKRNRGIHTADFGARDTVYLLAMRSLNRYVPLLFHLTEASSVHPWTVYGILRQIAGELSSFSEDINMLGEDQSGASLLPEYNHRKLSECYIAAQKLLVRLLNEITAGPEYVYELEFDGTYFASELQSSVFDGDNRYFIVLSAPSEHENTLASFSGMAKMGARESLPLLIARALPGIKAAHLAVPPQELPRKAGAVYYRVDSNSDLWQQVQKSKNLAVFWDSAPPELKVELMVVGRQ